MNNILINIPHSSIVLPDEFYKRLLISSEELEEELNLLTDLYTDKLLDDKTYNIIRAKYSRLYCDVERFANDDEEEMSKIGMGVVYTKTTSGKNLTRIDQDYKDKIIKEYYNKYHEKLYHKTKELLENYQKVIIIDLHSFSDEGTKKVGKKKLRETPDICLGYTEGFIDRKILNIVKDIFLKNGYTVEENYPFSGSIVPYEYYKNNNNRITSIMIEINKKVYLNSKDKFLQLSNVLVKLISKISD